MYKVEVAEGKWVWRDSEVLQVLLIVPGFRQIVQPPGTINTAKHLRPPTSVYTETILMMRDISSLDRLLVSLPALISRHSLIKEIFHSSPWGICE